MDADAWKTVLNTNLDGTFYFCREAANQMVFKQRSGRIINVSSVAATYVNGGQTNYAASKGAVNSFTKTLAVELGSRGVTVNAVAPGFIETDMVRGIPDKVRDRLLSQIPLKRFGTVEEVGRAVVYLVSSDGDYITGAELSINGGLLM